MHYSCFLSGIWMGSKGDSSGLWSRDSLCRQRPWEDGKKQVISTNTRTHTHTQIGKFLVLNLCLYGDAAVLSGELQGQQCRILFVSLRWVLDEFARPHKLKYLNKGMDCHDVLRRQSWEILNYLGDPLAFFLATLCAFSNLFNCLYEGYEV